MDRADRRERLGAVIVVARCFCPDSVVDPLSPRLAEVLGFKARTVGIKMCAQLDVVLASAKLPPCLGSAGTELCDLGCPPPRKVRVCLQGYVPHIAAIDSMYETLKAVRADTPRWLNQGCRFARADEAGDTAAYSKWSREFRCRSGVKLMSSAGLDRMPRTRHICGYQGRVRAIAAKEGIARCHL